MPDQQQIHDAIDRGALKLALRDAIKRATKDPRLTSTASEGCFSMLHLLGRRATLQQLTTEFSERAIGRHLNIQFAMDYFEGEYPADSMAVFIKPIHDAVVKFVASQSQGRDREPAKVRKNDIDLIHTRLNKAIHDHCEAHDIAPAKAVQMTDSCVPMFSLLYRALISSQSIPFAQVEEALTVDNMAAAIGSPTDGSNEELIKKACAVITSSVEALRARRASPPFLG